MPELPAALARIEQAMKDASGTASEFGTAKVRVSDLRLVLTRLERLEGVRHGQGLP